jgi:hypothetical protein
MAITLREYQIAAGAKYSSEDAAVIGPELERLAQEGANSESDIVAAAADDDSPLHRYFEWNEARAARKFRLVQAKFMVRSVTVLVRRPDGSMLGPRLAFNVRQQLAQSTEPPSRAIAITTRGVGPKVHVSRAPGQTQSRPGRRPSPEPVEGEAELMVQGALKHLFAWRERFRSYLGVYPLYDDTLSAVFIAINTTEQLARKRGLLSDAGETD